jgi:hypothetical protein
MNFRERQMLEILHEGRRRYGYCALKAEFEAEGTRTDELLRLVEIARRASLKIALKVGGCEAVRDLLEAKQIGVDYIIAPMIETPYALTKFIDAKNKVYSPDERQDTEFLFNLETHTAYSNALQIAQIAAKPEGVDGIVFGRVDFSLSSGHDRTEVNSPEVTEKVVHIGRICKDRELDFVVGGDISIHAIPHLLTVRATFLTRFETRKVVFRAEALATDDIQEALRQAVHFELLWLQNKRDYYGNIHAEDSQRIGMLEDRLKLLK